MKSKSAIASPCISVCSMDEDSGYCNGCYRTLKEIAEWDHYNDPQKLTLLELLDERRAGTKNRPQHC